MATNVQGSRSDIDQLPPKIIVTQQAPQPTVEGGANASPQSMADSRSLSKPNSVLSKRSGSQLHFFRDQAVNIVDYSRWPKLRRYAPQSKNKRLPIDAQRVTADIEAEKCFLEREGMQIERNIDLVKQRMNERMDAIASREFEHRRQLVAKRELEDFVAEKHDELQKDWLIPAEKPKRRRNPLGANSLRIPRDSCRFSHMLSFDPAATITRDQVTGGMVETNATLDTIRMSYLSDRPPPPTAGVDFSIMTPAKLQDSVVSQARRTDDRLRTSHMSEPFRKSFYSNVEEPETEMKTVNVKAKMKRRRHI